VCGRDNTGGKSLKNDGKTYPEVAKKSWRELRESKESYENNDLPQRWLRDWERK